MKLTGAALFAETNTLFGTNYGNKTAHGKPFIQKEYDKKTRSDSITVSSKGRAASLVESLTKQKAALEDAKNKFMASAVEKGLSPDMIKYQLASYNEQIRNIDKQIAEITAERMKAEVEKKQIKLKEDKPKTKEEADNKKLADITEMSIATGNIDKITLTKARIDEDISILKSEIELDKSYAGSMSGADNLIKGKEELLAELEAKVLNMESDMGKKISEINEKIREESNENNTSDS